MLTALMRWIERAIAPTTDLLGSMPPSAIRQILFTL
jgi:hypothetical protein